MSTVIVGGAGFIGNSIATHLSTKYPRQELVILDNLSNSNPQRVEELTQMQNIVFIEGDMTDAETVRELFDQYPPTVIINATHAQTPEIAAKELVYGSFNLLSTAATLPNKPLFVDISSVMVYGEKIEEGHTSPGLETDQLQPQSMIAAVEASVDLLTSSYFHTDHIPTVILRTTNIFGPHQNDNDFIPQLIYKALNNRDIQIDTTELENKNWLYINDFMDLIDRVVQTDPAEIGGATFNIGGSTEYTMLEVSQLLLTILNRPSELISLKNINQLPPLSKRIDCEKAQHVFEWTPKTDFKQALHETIQWYQTAHAPTK